MNAAAPRCLAHILFFTADPLAKLDAPLASLRRQRAGDVRVTVVSGHVFEADDASPGDIEFLRFPGESPLQLRRRIPEIAAAASWIVVLEDHNHLHERWLSDLRRALLAAPAEATAVVGGSDNRTSTDPWSWANFLLVQGFYWTPCQQPLPEPLFFNVAFRRELIPPRRYALGEFEVLANKDMMSQASFVSAFPVNHVQFRKFPSVLHYHWCNGRTTGAMMARNAPDGFRHVLRHARRVAGARLRSLAQVIRSHPKAGLLPGGTMARIRVLAFCHAAGTLAGGLLGEGRTPWRLE
jgi:hypothetical protein